MSSARWTLCALQWPKAFQYLKPPEMRLPAKGEPKKKAALDTLKSSLGSVPN